ncbi:MAG: L-amino acid N-acyltransferase [Gammaproteobacteria bacterium]|jgi:phosphinothricin acetyltransferase|nr:L-amino acid N-acyltransferase [Gammaproteobacteria bacterium]
MIDDACRQDLAEILAIYNEVIRSSTAVYTELELSQERGESWFDHKRAGGFPFIVSKDDSGITGFGTFADFRAPPCYRHTVEHSVHVRRDCRGKGIGRKLVIELMDRACTMQKHIMIAGIDADNVSSIQLHQSLGFVNVGHFHEVGFKFGRWLDLVFLECRLPATKASQL